MKKGKVTISIKEYNNLIAPNKISFFGQSFICPLCSHENKLYQHEAERGNTKEIVYCDLEDGGCDEEILLITDVKTTISLKATKLNL